jgi:arginase
MASAESNIIDTVSLVGIPFDASSTYLRGAAQAPPRIREALYCDSTNLWTEDGMDLGKPGTFHDAGDLNLPERAEEAFPTIEKTVSSLLDSGRPLIVLGGDHSITYPVLRGFRRRFADLTVLHFDAHPDLYDNLGGRLSHACPFARVMEEKLVRRLVQVGIRTINRHQLEQAHEFGVEVISMRNMTRLAGLRLEGPMYISFDVDVLDPAFAPGISHYEPGGMSVREVLNAIQGLRVPIAGADIVEYNPVRDENARTAFVCAKILKETAAAMIRGGAAPAEWI